MNGLFTIEVARSLKNSNHVTCACSLIRMYVHTCTYILVRKHAQLDAKEIFLESSMNIRYEQADLGVRRYSSKRFVISRCHTIRLKSNKVFLRFYTIVQLGTTVLLL